MNVWVRTQDRSHLIKVVDICYRCQPQDVLSNNYNPIHCVFDERARLGCYDTQERCLEIIDEIQGLLMGSQMLIFKDIDVTEAEMEYLKPFKGVMYKVGNEPQITVNQFNTVVYEMPQE